MQGNSVISSVKLEALNRGWNLWTIHLSEGWLGVRIQLNFTIYATRNGGPNMRCVTGRQ
jgi:hypothetical protein